MHRNTTTRLMQEVQDISSDITATSRSSTGSGDGPTTGVGMHQKPPVIPIRDRPLLNAAGSKSDTLFIKVPYDII